MQHKLFKTVLVFMILSLALSLAPTGNVQAAAPWYVRPDGSDTECDGSVDAAASAAPNCAFATIPHAVSSAAAGDTVNVAAGTYNEAVVIEKTLTLSGPNAGINPNTGTRAAEAILTAPVRPGLANGIQIIGFKFSGVTNAGGVQGAIENQSSPSGNNLLVENNIFEDLTVSGLYLAGGFTGAQITGNYVDGTTFSGIILGNAHNSTISGNTVKNVAAEGIQLSGVSGNVEIFGNSVDNAGMVLNEADKGGIRLYGTTFDGPVKVYNNVVTNSKNGVSVIENANITGKNISVYWNSVNATNEVAIYNGATEGELNASCNWWGNLSGPTGAGNPGGTGGTYSGAVTFGPWMITGTDASANAGFQLPAFVTVTPPGEVSAAVNDFRMLQNAISCAAPTQTIDVRGTYNWSATAPLANAAYLDSYQDSVEKDIRGIALPGVNNLAITSSTNDAHILGAGDVEDGALIFSSFLYSDKAPGNANLIVEKLNIDNFEGAVTLGWNDNDTGTFNNSQIRHNQVTLAGDKGDAVDWIQNIAFYFGPGTNQSLVFNTVTFKADGDRTVGYSGPKNGASFGFQNGTTGGTAYNGLHINDNTFQVGSGSNGLEETFGIWENGHNDTAGTLLFLNANNFLGRAGDDLDHAFLLSSQTTGLEIRNNTFNRVDQVFTATKSQGHTAGDTFSFTNNTLINVGGPDGIFLKNVTNDTVPVNVTILWNISNTIDGETGIRGLNELSVQATHASRPSSAATNIQFVNGTPAPMPVTVVNDNWGTVARFTDPDGLGTGNPIAFSYNTFNDIEHGVLWVADGGTVHVLAGTYTEPGQIAMAKSVTLIGEDRDTTIVKPAANTGTSGDARGWFLASSADKVFNMSNFTLDGTGFYIYRAIQSYSTGTISNNIIKNIGAPGYQGVGIAMYNSMTVADNDFSKIGRIGIFAFGPLANNVVIRDNTYTGKGVGNWLDYGVELGGGAKGTLTGNVIMNNRGVAVTDGSDSAGILVTTYFAAGTEAEIVSNTLLNNSTAIYVGYNAADVSVVNARFNRIVGNGSGITTTAPAVTALNNWWGCNEGPAGADCNGVDANVLADPWLVLSAAAVPATVQTPNPSVITADLTMNSDDEDTSANGNVPDGILADYTAPDGGSVNPITGLTVDGVFTSTTFIPPAAVGVYQVCTEVDEELLCLDLNAENAAPLAVADSYTVGSNATLTVLVADGVLKNDTDLNGDSLTAVLNTDVTNGTLALAADGSFVYTPDALFTGTDTFTYHANDGLANSNIVTVTITVEDQNFHVFLPIISR